MRAGAALDPPTETSFRLIALDYPAIVLLSTGRSRGEPGSLVDAHSRVVSYSRRGISILNVNIPADLRHLIKR